jgi:RNA polymerase sigma-70 factor (ECF subfamily)
MPLVPAGMRVHAATTGSSGNRRLQSSAVMDDPAVSEAIALDVAAVARVAGGDAVALRDLYDRYGKLVYSFAYRLTGDATLSEECVQDVFVALWRRAADFDPSRAKLTTWLFVVARNRAVDLGRQKARRPELRDDLEPAGAAPDPADLAAGADEAQRVAEAMAELPEEQLVVLRLAYFDGLSHAEIAELIGIPLGTVKGRVRLALERLRSLSTSYALEADQ